MHSFGHYVLGKHSYQGPSQFTLRKDLRRLLSLGRAQHLLRLNYRRQALDLARHDWQVVTAGF